MIRYLSIAFFIILSDLINAQIYRRVEIKDSVDSIEINTIMPSNLNNVKLYEKIEFAINLNDSIENLVNSFVLKSDSLNKLNPFNPEDISIEADFILNNDSLNITLKKFGFYYEEFQRLSNKHIKIPQKELFRLRFTPKKTGNWQTIIRVIVNGKLFTISDTISFTVNNSNLNDFVGIGKNPYYLEQNEKTFIPIGINISNPLSTSTDAWTGKKSPPSAYTKYHAELEEYKQNGANYFRLLKMPWNLEIEFEELGNYSSRMSSAWEMDKILEKSNELNLFIHLCLQAHYSFQNAGSYALFYWDWVDKNSPKYDSLCSFDTDEGYCYFKDLGIKDPVDFLSHDEAKKYYKNKIRYYISRYGYSTNIALIELMGEINNIGKNYTVEHIKGKGCVSLSEYSAYAQDSIVPVLIYQWHKELSAYIKENLNHKDHLLAVNYAGSPDIERGDSSYYIDNIDVITYNKYGIDISKGKYINRIEAYKNIKKPFMFSEIGVGDKSIMQTAEYTYFVRELYLAFFTGTAGTNNSWYGRYNPYGVWENFKNFTEFVDSLDLSDTNWTAYAIDRRDYKADLVCLKNSKLDKSIGIISNLTFNYYTQSKDTIGMRNERLNKNQLIAENVEAGNFGKALKIYKLNARKDYKIEWWDLINNIKLGESYQKSGYLGNLKLKHPDLLIENGEKRHLIGFKVKLLDP